jgi:hypothetical protein
VVVGAVVVGAVVVGAVVVGDVGAGFCEADEPVELDRPLLTKLLPPPQPALRDRPTISVPKKSLFIGFPGEKNGQCGGTSYADISTMGASGRDMNGLKFLRNLMIFH